MHLKENSVSQNILMKHKIHNVSILSIITIWIDS